MTRKTHHAKRNAEAEDQHPEQDRCEASEPVAPQTEASPTACAEDQAGDIEARIVELERELEQERSQALRVLADFQNFRRRNDEQRAEQARYATQELVLGLLPILDNFERAIASARENQSIDSLLAGVELTQRQIMELLKRNGVEPIVALQQEFDPALHEAVMRVDAEDCPDNTVVEEMQRGYTMHGRVIRPSMVKVAAHP